MALFALGKQAGTQGAEDWLYGALTGSRRSR